MSNAADRSKSTGAAKSPRSTASRISDITCRMAVTVECPARKPDCSGGRSSADAKYSIIWRTTSFHAVWKALEDWKLAGKKSDRTVSKFGGIGGIESCLLHDRRNERVLEPTWEMTMQSPVND